MPSLTRTGRGLSFLVPVVLILLGVIFYQHLSLPFSNPQFIVGPAMLSHYLPATNWWRYLALVFFWGIAGLFCQRSFPEVSNPAIAVKSGAVSLFFLLLLLWALTATIATVFFDSPLGRLDLFHEGERLAGAYQWKATHHLWSGIYFSHGVLRSGLATALAWGSQPSIGCDRLLRAIFWGAIPWSFTLFLAALFIFVSSIRGNFSALLLVTILWAIHLICDRHFELLYDRDAFFLIGASLWILALTGSRLWAWLAGVWIVITFAYAIDRGAYLLAASVLGMAMGRAIPIRYWILGLLSAALTAFLIVGSKEAAAFLEQFRFQVQFRDAFFGDRYPPFAISSWRYGLPILLIGIQSFSLASLAKSYWKTPTSLVSLHLFFVAASLFYFRSAFAQLNLNHMKYASAFAFFGIGFLGWRILEQYPSWRQITLSFLAGVIVVVGLFQAGSYALFAPGLFSSLRLWHQELGWNDALFLQADESRVVDVLSPLLASQSCLFIFDDEPAWYYLLRKPSCTKYLMTSLGSTNSSQKEIVGNLETQKPLYIISHALSSTPVNREINNRMRLPVVWSYLTEHYRPCLALGSLEVMKRRD